MVFEEKQQLNKYWITAIMLFPTLILLYVLFINKLFSNKILLITAISLTFLLIIFIFLISWKLTIKVGAQGISLKLTYFSELKFTWAEIKNISIKKINPLTDFGGYGYRLVLKKNTIGFIISGKQAICIEPNNGKIIAFTIINDIGFFDAVKSFSAENLIQNTSA